MATPDISSKKYLGDVQVVSRLLKAFAREALTYSGDPDGFEAFLDGKSRGLARVFLGQHAGFPGPAWFGPGQIDVAVAQEAGIASDDPEERVAGGLNDLVFRLLSLAQDKAPDWKEQSGDILKRYTYVFMGIPPHLT